MSKQRKTKRFKNTRPKKNNRGEKRKRKYNESQIEYLEAFDSYFGDGIQKDEAGISYSHKNSHKSFGTLSRKNSDDGKLAILEWFISHFRSMRENDIWVMENDTVYLIDKRAKKVFQIYVHPNIKRKAIMRNHKLLKMWINKSTDTLNGHSDAFPRLANNWSGSGHKWFFDNGNAFFFKALGYEYEKIDLAPGWWYDCGASNIAHGLIKQIKEEYKPIKKKILQISKQSSEENKRDTHTNSLKLLIYTTATTYRDTETDRIAKSFTNVLRKKYKGENVRKAIIDSDTDGNTWTGLRKAEELLGEDAMKLVDSEFGVGDIF